MHCASTRRALLLSQWQAWLGALNVNARMNLESIRNKSKQRLQRGAQFWCECRLTHICLKERGDHIELLHFFYQFAGWSNRGLTSNHAARPLKFGRINCGNLAVIVQIIKWLVNAGKVLSVGKSQELIFAETVGLVDLDLR